MERDLTASELLALSKAFGDLSAAIGTYRTDHSKELSQKEKSDLENRQWTLFNTASDLNAKSALLKITLVEADLKTLQAATAAMQNVVGKIQDIKRAMSITAKAISVGGAIFTAAATGNPSVLVAAASAIMDEISPPGKKGPVATG